MSSQSVTSVITKCDNFKVLANATIISKYTRTVSPQQWSIYVPTISQMHYAEVKKQSRILTQRNTLNSMSLHLLDHKRLRALTFKNFCNVASETSHKRGNPKHAQYFLQQQNVFSNRTNLEQNSKAW